MSDVDRENEFYGRVECRRDLSRTRDASSGAAATGTRGPSHDSRLGVMIRLKSRSGDR
ncbi:MAG: hypothetical protein QOE41_2297 [Mycobacterium sp.]|nr:hypothetical protein [Mycobacterium sp.]